MEEISTSLGSLWEAFSTGGVTVHALQLFFMVIAVVGAFFIHRYSQKALVKRLESGGLSRLHSLLLKIGQRLAFPLSGLFTVLVGQLVFRQFGLETPLLDVLAKLLVALAIVRLIVYALRVGIAPGPGLKAWEKIISTSVWLVLALHLVGWLPHVTAGMDQLAISLGEPDDIVREFVEKSPFPYPLAIDTEEVLGISLQIYALPTVMVIDTQGRITYLRPGLSDAETLRQVLSDSGVKQAFLEN